jgi:senataxin
MFLCRYFGAFTADVLIGFYQNFEGWELTTILEDISGQTLAAAPPAIAYRIVSNLTILQDPRILSIIHREPPKEALKGWPPDPLPPGLLLLQGDEKLTVRKWAEMQASLCKVIPIPRDRFSASHVTAFRTLVAALDPMSLSEESLSTRFPLAPDFSDLWSSFCSVLKLVPIEYLQTGDIYRLVNGHLHDTGPRKLFKHNAMHHSSYKSTQISDMCYVVSNISPAVLRGRSG